MAKEAQRVAQQGLGRPIISAEIGGRRVVAVGNKLYYIKGKTFHDFLGDYLRDVLDAAWGNTELKKPLSDRHPILQWYDSICNLQRRSGLTGDSVVQVEGTHHLGYEKGDAKPAGRTNHRNGTSRKRITTDDDLLDVEIPRDREGTFDPVLIAKGERRFDDACRWRIMAANRRMRPTVAGSEAAAQPCCASPARLTWKSGSTLLPVNAGLSTR